MAVVLIVLISLILILISCGGGGDTSSYIVCPMTEILNAANVSFYGQKTETIIPGREDKHQDNFGTKWPILMSIKNSLNISIIGEEGPSPAEKDRGLFEVIDSSGVTLVNVGRRDRGGSFVPEKDWYFVKKTNEGVAKTVDAIGFLGLFRR